MDDIESKVLRLGEHITILPIIHGSGDCSLQVRQLLLDQNFDRVAVPLPRSFQSHVERAIAELPHPSIVVQRRDRSAEDWQREWTPESDSHEDDEDDDEIRFATYVPIDPCQPVIAAIRGAMGEHIPRDFIDLETQDFDAHNAVLPDPYALRKVPVAKFAAAMVPHLPPVPDGQPMARVDHMADQLRALDARYESVLFVCSVLDWPWIRAAFQDASNLPHEHEEVEETEWFQVEQQSLLFMLGELPFITDLYEHARAELESDDNLSIDGVKELLLAARERYRADLKSRAKKVTPHLLSQCMKYIRNLSLIERRLTPDLYTIVIAAKQMVGDQFALHVVETVRDYRYFQSNALPEVKMGIGRARFPDDEVYSMVSRLPGPPLVWRNCELQRRPDRSEVEKWKTQWNPFSQCSYPPEDELIENFRSHVFDRAREIMGADLVQTEKFTTSIKDGLDIRETIRHWYDGDLYVKVLPPARGNLDTAVMLFDSPADPRDYPWRTTWFAEHAEESTLAFFATDFRSEIVGPGIGLANYGGALFLFPPIAIPDIWNDPRLDFVETMEERLLAAACLHSRSRHIALLSPLPPGSAWRKLASKFGRRLVHVPLGQFSDTTVQQLRMVHVLNGREVRSYAAHFIKRV